MNPIDVYLEENQPRFITELCDYLRFPSVSAQPAHQRDLLNCAEWLAAHCRKLGLEAEICPTRGHPIVLARTPRRAGSRRPNTGRTDAPKPRLTLGGAP